MWEMDTLYMYVCLITICESINEFYEKRKQMLSHNPIYDGMEMLTF